MGTKITTDNLLTRTVQVNRNRSAWEALEATERELCYSKKTEKIIETMPNGTATETELVFFNLGREISCADLEREYEHRCLNPADPFSLAAVNEADHSFANEHPNGTLWKDEQGRYCFISFNLWNTGYGMSIDYSNGDWPNDWWFAGIRKVKAV